ncbi:hypothetical protein HDF16_002728 [Granulicella aggregans]|uniref:Alpha-mannosidase n=1 Tax=Granulicella aggregans TaxID=474949 RepID=A0A7W8E3X1_9BACT|nr:glycoside hydrolase family 38 C-terminal domain-containing protein [Granulicella aggregans]MBB5058022.1 hypothetical protein [Granulicella aggregans]
MKRRELLKGMTLAAGGALLPMAAWPMKADAEPAMDDLPLAAPVRGLMRKDGKLVQPIEMSIPHAGGAGEAIVSIDGHEVERHALTAGMNTFYVTMEPVDAVKNVKVDVKIAGDVTSRLVQLQPVRKVKVYVLPHSHHDLGYTDLQADVEEKQMQNILQGIDLAERTSSYPEGSRFIWNLEVLWGADLFMRRKSEAEKARFIEAVKKGWVSLNGMYANELTGLCRPEELLQLFRYSSELGAKCGVKVNSAMASDVPGFTWGTVTAMSQAGIKYFSTAPNYFDRIGKMMVEWQDKPFWWVSRSGKEKVLLWIPWTGYALSHVMKLDRQWVGKYQDRLDSVAFPYEISHVRWSGHGDNAAPDPELSEFVKGWNAEFEWPKFEISSTSAAFADFEKTYGEKIPTFKGDLTPYWEDGAGSSALETRMSRVAADRLTQAAAISAMLAPGAYKAEAFHEAWRNVLLYSEHTWGAWCSVSDSENPFTTKQWDYKRKFAVDAEKQSMDLLAQMLGTAGVGDGIDVHNSASWARSELVVLSKEISAVGDQVKDGHGKLVASQRLSTGELAFWVEGVPAFGTARYRVVKGAAHAPARAVTVKDGLLSNGIVEVRVDRSTGNIAELKLHGCSENLVESDGEQANAYLFLAGGDVSKLQRSGVVTIVEEEKGPLVATLRIECSAPGSRSLVRRVQLTAGADWVELSNVVDKERAALNPRPGNAAQDGEFAQRGSKESVQFAFPFHVPEGKMRMDIPLAEMRPEFDQLPGACKNWLPVGRWVDVSNDKTGVTWVTLDAPLIEVGEVSAVMLGSQRDPNVWRDYIEPTQKFYSWVMNNHWGTNYRAYQEGPVEFRYALRPHGGYDALATSKLAMGMSQPLVATRASGRTLREPLLSLDSPDVVVLSLKPSEDGKAMMVTLFGASGENRETRLRWRSNITGKSSVSDTSEAEERAVDGGTIHVPGWGVVTVRVQIGGAG